MQWSENYQNCGATIIYSTNASKHSLQQSDLTICVQELYTMLKRLKFYICSWIQSAIQQTKAFSFTEVDLNPCSMPFSKHCVPNSLTQTA